MRNFLRKIIYSIIFVMLLTAPAQAKGKFEILGKCTVDHGAYYDLTQLKDGRILISDFVRTYPDYGDDTPATQENFLTRFEIYNPKTKKFEKISQPKIWHDEDTIPIVLDDGKVLLFGPWHSRLVDPYELKIHKESLHAEIYDPETDTYKIVGKIQIPRGNFGITKLNNGKVLITNGSRITSEKFGLNKNLWHSELFDPTTGEFSIHTESAVDIRKKYAKVGDDTYDYDYYEKYIKARLHPKYPAGDLRNKLPVPEVKIYEERMPNCRGVNVALDNGEVLVFWDNYDNAAEIYNPDTGEFRRVGDFKYASSTYPFKLPDGRVLCVAGVQRTLEIFDPKTEQFSDVGTFPLDGKYRYLLLLPNGKFLVYNGETMAGIFKANFSIRDILIYDPITNTAELIDKQPFYIQLYRSIVLEDGSIFFIADVFGQHRGVIYHNDKLK